MNLIKDRKNLKIDLIEYLENELQFRDYRILPYKLYGKVNKIGVHQVVDAVSMEYDIDDAVNTFVRDGFPSIYIYI